MPGCFSATRASIDNPVFLSKNKIRATRGISLTLFMTDASLSHFSLPSSFSVSSVFGDVLLTSSRIFDHPRFRDVFSSPSRDRTLLSWLLSLFLVLPPVFSPTPAFTSRLWILLSNTYTARTAIRTLVDGVCTRVCVCVSTCVRSLARARIARRRTEKRGFSF